MSEADTSELEQQRLAHTLLIELLSYQFCSPVKWIDTQDVIISEKAIDRIVEIGPSSTLVDMARRTIAAKYQNFDAAHATQRSLFSTSKNMDSICYNEDADRSNPNTATDVASMETSATAQNLAPLALDTRTTPEASIDKAAVLPFAKPETSNFSTIPSKSINDACITANVVLRTIVSVATRKTFSDLSPTSSIKTIVEGRSTLQNEIIGDLGEEFHELPENPEDISLEDMATFLQKSHNGTMGKRSKTLLGKMFSDKMPGGFTTKSARDHLRSNWNLQAGRQDNILLVAISQQPQARLATPADAKQFLDTLAQQYILTENLSSPSVNKTETNDTGLQGQTTFDPAMTEQLHQSHKDQQSLNRKILEIIAGHSNINLQASDLLEQEWKQSIDQQRIELDGWKTELGEAFELGIKPMFEPLKTRRYNSWWNWSLQDFTTLFYDLVNGALRDGSDQLRVRIDAILNRVSPRLIDTMIYFRARISHRTGENYETTRGVLSHLIAASDDKDSLESTLVEKKLDLKRPHYLGVGLTDKQHGASLSIQKKAGDSWRISTPYTAGYIRTLCSTLTPRMSFYKKNVLITGAGTSSIGAILVANLLRAGASVIVTTNSYSMKTTRSFQSIYAQHGSEGSELVVVPFNQGSCRDVEALIEYIYNPKQGLGWDLDHIVPFAAISENGNSLDSINSRSELAHRIMLTNVLRLLGEVKKQKKQRRIRSRPAQVILPLSPNHGTFGNDGLYAESKLGLQSLLDKWSSEDWNEYLSICGANIGWTRGTGLMSSNDALADGISEMGVRTFSQDEMAFLVLGLMQPFIVSLCQNEPILADLSGRLASVPNLKKTTEDLRRSINEEVSIKQFLLDNELPTKKVQPGNNPSFSPPLNYRENIKIQFPPTLDYDTTIKPLNLELDGMVDLESIVVVVGFAEVGPWGNSRTRWEIESRGQFSLEGCIEMAMMMGLIKSDTRATKDNVCGWIDSETGQVISSTEVKVKYEKKILEHSGIRIVEPRPEDGSDPRKLELLHEVLVNEDMKPFTVSTLVARNFAMAHSAEQVAIIDIPETGESQVFVKKNTRLMIPKAISRDHYVAGQVPSGWGAQRYGIPESIASQVDPATLYALVSVAEAFHSAGISDIYELYENIHVSEIANCIGSGLGGSASLHKLFKQRFQDKSIEKDVLAEVFVNSIGAWVNMLLLSSAGPNRTPAGACATSLESLDIGYELITHGKSKVCIIGGSDGILQDVSQEFENMKTTSNATEEARRGRNPREASRPSTSTRHGFVESEGCGIQIITSAKLAIDMGLPIYGVVAYTQTASDKTGRSIPTPGQGILTAVRETLSKFPLPLLDIKYRQRNLKLQQAQIMATEASDIQNFQESVESLEQQPGVSSDAKMEYLKQYEDEARQSSKRQMKEAQQRFGNRFAENDHRISPLRAALATWGLTADHIGVASFHGTSTIQNDENECDIINQELIQLGRTRGNNILAVFQKHLTGHPKAAAAAWMFNGCLQILNSGLVPGNNNADNIDSSLAKYDFLLFPNHTIQTDGIDAFSVTSFGFGQKGAQTLGVHAKYVFATIGEECYKIYLARLKERKRKATRHFQHGLATHTLCLVKDRPPYKKENEAAYLRNPLARLEKKIT